MKKRWIHPACWHVALAGLIGAGCINPSYGPEPFLCAVGGECPSGYSCIASRCVQGGRPQLDGPAPVLDAAGDLDSGSDRGLPLPGEWVAVFAATYTMGSPAEEPCRSQSEAQRQVTLSRGFSIMAHQVTRAEFFGMLGYAPEDHGCGEQCPVVDITWHEAVAMCDALSAREGRDSCYRCSGQGASVRCEVEVAYSGAKIYTCPGYRLPTEAEWELAARAGSQTALYNGPLVGCDGSDANADAIAWYLGNSSGTLHPVGEKVPNAWGLYDMLGNAWDWCHDRFTEQLGSNTATDPVFFEASVALGARRGGSFTSAVQYLRLANRASLNLDSRHKGTGVRCLRTTD